MVIIFTGEFSKFLLIGEEQYRDGVGMPGHNHDMPSESSSEQDLTGGSGPVAGRRKDEVYPGRDAEKRRAYLREYMRAWRKRNPGKLWKTKKSPEAHRAQEAVRRAIKSGRLVRPEACEVCNNSGKIEAAHSNYANYLDVRWLCQFCHRSWDYYEPKDKKG